jgi:hypothetical protein
MSKWNPETIHAALEPIVAELGRFPKREELSARGLGGLSTAMGKHGGVAEWRTRFVVTPVADAVVVDVVETVEVAPAAEVTQEAIAERAYYIALEQQGGDPFEHWVKAERELTAA